MGKQYVNELNKAIYNSPVLARSEILSSRKETLFDTIEGCFVRAGLLDTLAQEMELQILKGDFSAMQLPPYQEPAHRPLMPGARRKEEERRARYKWAQDRLLAAQQMCQQRWEDGWSMAEILMMERAI